MAVMYVHPVVAVLCLLCAGYAFWLGLRKNHAAMRARHIAFGSIALGGLIVVWGVGVAQTFQNQHVFLLYETHFYEGTLVLPFAILGLIVGQLLAHGKGGKVLAILHGVMMGAGIVIACVAAFTGVQILSNGSFL